MCVCVCVGGCVCVCGRVCVCVCVCIESKVYKINFVYLFLHTQHYEVWIKDKVEQSRERSNAFPYTSVS